MVNDNDRERASGLSRRSPDANVVVERQPMPQPRECPLCGGSMRPRQRDVVERVPGYTTTMTRQATERVCPDCDYFEEVEEERASGL